MTAAVSLPVAVAVVGALAHLTLPPKWADLGRYTFLAGLLAALLK